MREPREPSTADDYERPQQTWHCGLMDEGPPCPLGPSGQGVCPAASACRPARDGQRWQCNRSALRGGPCIEGPGPDGSCSIVHRCTPVRSLRTRRGRFVIGVALAALGAVVMVLSSSWRNEVLAPGPLSTHHAQLLNGNSASLRCAQCHAAAELTIAQWWGSSLDERPAGPTQSQLCLGCHDKTINRDAALSAHGVPLDKLTTPSDGFAQAHFDHRDRDPREPIACAACHREHQGLSHNLAAISDAACQSCHRVQFASFGGDHPEFEAWPYVRRTRIVFDHASHQAKHFASERKKFDCAACHEASADGRHMLTASYSTMCATCHDKSIAGSLAEGMPLVSLPTLDAEALAAGGHAVQGWPDEASGDFEGSLPMPTLLLLMAEREIERATKALGPQLDLYDVDPDDGDHLAVAADVANAVKALSEDLASRGQVALKERLQKLLGRELSNDQLSALASGLSPDVATAYRDRWFGKIASSTDSADRAALMQQVTAGGWVRDEASMSLRYRLVGHADPWMRAWLDIAAEAAGGAHAAVAEPLLRAAIKPSAPGQCGTCHSVERNAAGRLQIQWRPANQEARPKGLTHFDHGPHLIQPQTSDCTSCHRITAAAPPSTAYSGDDPSTFAAGFEPMSRQACVTCHVAGAAGDSCLQCHNYHGHESQPSSVTAPIDLLRAAGP